jgi:pimeloyl-ACP methyl ester carboxylesterase
VANRNGSGSGTRCHIVLIPGFGGFDALGRVEYYAGITRLFQHWSGRHPDLPVVLHYFDNLPTAAVVTRATRLRKYLAKRMARGEILKKDKIVLVGHSTGGLDIRQLIWDLHKPENRRIVVDGGLPVSAQDFRDRIDGVIFLSVPHWGTNIADWVYSNVLLRKMVIADLRAALAGSQVYLLDRFEAAVANGTAEFIGADVLLALRDALTEANADWNEPDPSRVADALETASELELYFRQMVSNFHVINDLTSEPHAGEKSPAHFGDQDRVDELAIWDQLEIRTLSYATVGGRPFHFHVLPGCPAPVFNLTNPFDDLAIALACGPGAGTDLSYRICYRACAGGPLRWPNPAGIVARVLGTRPSEPLELWDNDGIVNTVSMLWPRGETVLVQADHLDVVGHYRLSPPERKHCYLGSHPPRTYESYDTLKSWPQFEQKKFEGIWNEIFFFAAMPRAFRQNRTSPLSPVAIATSASAIC